MYDGANIGTVYLGEMSQKQYLTSEFSIKDYSPEM